MTKTIFITGASSGIGLCCALGLKARGYEVFASARRNRDLAALKAKGLHPIHLNLNDSASIQQAVTEVLDATGGKLDALFNNAGYGQPGAIEDLSRDSIRLQFEANVFGPIELTNLIIPVMRRQGHGRIINTSSILGMITLPYRGAYNASKYALEGFTDTLRQELDGTGIYVVLIEPGPIISNFRAAAFSAYKNNIPTGGSVHADSYQKLEKYYGETKEAMPSMTRPPEAVLEKLIQALESSKPKIRYYVTPATYILTTLKRVLPHRAMDWVLKQVAKDENR